MFSRKDVHFFSSRAARILAKSIGVGLFVAALALSAFRHPLLAEDVQGSKEQRFYNEWVDLCMEDHASSSAVNRILEERYAQNEFGSLVFDALLEQLDRPFLYKHLELPEVFALVGPDADFCLLGLSFPEEDRLRQVIEEGVLEYDVRFFRKNLVYDDFLNYEVRVFGEEVHTIQAIWEEDMFIIYRGTRPFFNHLDFYYIFGN